MERCISFMLVYNRQCCILPVWMKTEKTSLSVCLQRGIPQKRYAGRCKSSTSSPTRIPSSLSSVSSTLLTSLTSGRKRNSRSSTVGLPEGQSVSVDSSCWPRCLNRDSQHLPPKARAVCPCPCLITGSQLSSGGQSKRLENRLILWALVTC